MNYITKTPFMEIYEELSEINNLVEDTTLNELPNSPGIYCIIFDAKDSEGNTVEKKYVGLAKNIKARAVEHQKASRLGGRDYLVYNAMRKYPYKVIVLEECSIDQLNDKEQKWIAKLHTYLNDDSQSSESVKITYNGKAYNLSCNGPGYNMTAGGEGTVYYTAEIIQELIDLYKDNDYNHTKTRKLFIEKHNTDTHLNTLCLDTLRLIVEAAGLPWQNETKKGTVVYANTLETKYKLEKDKNSADGFRKRKYAAIVENNSDPKYCRQCASRREAEVLMDFIYNRVKTDLGSVFETLPNAKRVNTVYIKYLIDNNLYDKYLDLSQYDLAALPPCKKQLGGEGATSKKITTGRYSLFTPYYDEYVKN